MSTQHAMLREGLAMFPSIRLLRTRRGSHADGAILDSLELIQADLVPGEVHRKDLETLWRVSGWQVYRRLRWIRKLGMLSAVKMGGGIYRLDLVTSLSPSASQSAKPIRP